MVAAGVLLVILGVASFVLPMVGVPVPAIPDQPWIGVIVAALGLITVLFGARRLRAAGAVIDAPD